MGKRRPRRIKPIPQTPVSGSSRWMTWLVIAVMVGSTLGFALVSMQGREPPPPQQLPDIDGQPTVLTFSADAVDANAVEIFSSMLLTAGTMEAEIGKIDMELSGIAGIGSISSRYKPAGPSIAAGLMYIADISLEPGYTAKDVVIAVRENSALLTNIDGASLGLVALPKQVQLFNADLNLSKLHTFEDRLVQAYFSVETQKGDSLVVSLTLNLSGEQAFDVTAFEASNLTVGSGFIMLEQDLQVAALRPQLRMVADMNYSAAPEETALRTAFLGIPGITSGTVEFTAPATTATIEFDQNIAMLEENIESALLSVTGIEAVRFFSARPALNFDFDAEADYKKLRSDAESSLAALGAVPRNFIDPRINLLADLNTTTASTGQIASGLQTAASQYNIPGPKLYQYAEFTAETLADPDTGRAYTVDGGAFTGLVTHGTATGSTVELSIFFMGFRDEAREISAFEAETG